MNPNLPLRFSPIASAGGSTPDGKVAAIQLMSTNIRADHINENIPTTNTMTSPIFHIL